MFGHICRNHGTILTANADLQNPIYWCNAKFVASVTPSDPETAQKPLQATQRRHQGDSKRPQDGTEATPRWAILIWIGNPRWFSHANFVASAAQIDPETVPRRVQATPRRHQSFGGATLSGTCQRASRFGSLNSMVFAPCVIQLERLS